MYYSSTSGHARASRKGAVSDEFDRAEAVALAKELDRPDLYEHQGSDPICDLTRGAVAGAAAVVLAYQPQSRG